MINLEYYIVNEKDKQAIYHISGRQISDWYDEILEKGLLSGQSEYYIVEDCEKYAIFHVSGKQISKWCDYIDSVGLVEGQSEYYIAENITLCIQILREEH